MPRDYSKIALTDDARASLLEETPGMRFATVDVDGLPHVVPVTFVELDGTVYFETDADSVKTRNVEATGKAAGVVDRGADDYTRHRGLLWRGDASVVEDRDTERAVERALFGTEKTASSARGSRAGEDRPRADSRGLLGLPAAGLSPRVGAIYRPESGRWPSDVSRSMPPRSRWPRRVTARRVPTRSRVR